jgi:hypothetical protein
MNPKKYTFGVSAGQFLGFLVHRHQLSPPLLLSNFVLHQHRRVSLSLPDPLLFLHPRTRSPEHCVGDLTLRGALFLVEPKFHPLSSFVKSTISITSPRRSSLTNFLCLPALQSPERRRHPRNLAAPALSLVESPPLSFPSMIRTTPKSAVSS